MNHPTGVNQPTPLGQAPVVYNQTNRPPLFKQSKKKKKSILNCIKKLYLVIQQFRVFLNNYSVILMVKIAPVISTLIEVKCCMNQFSRLFYFETDEWLIDHTSRPPRMLFPKRKRRGTKWLQNNQHSLSESRYQTCGCLLITDIHSVR